MIQTISSIDLAKKLNMDLHGNVVEISGFHIDSRKIQPGDCFVALKGQHVDGHDFLEKAKSNGAVCAIVENNKKIDLSQINVPNTEEILLDLAQICRDQTTIPFVCITGSCGKTTVRSFLENICSAVGPTLASTGSFNNHIGMPLTLFRLEQEHQFGVLEIGANHHQEIHNLTKIINPSVSILTNANPVHLDGFGSLEGVAKAKGEIFDFLEHNGTAVINNDNDFSDYWKSLIKPDQSIISFGKNTKSDVYFSDLENKNGFFNFILNTPIGNIKINLNLLGEYQVYNALAAAAGAIGLNISLEKIKLGLEHTQPESHRMNIYKLKDNIDIIDDCYNANPMAVEQALNLLDNIKNNNIKNKNLKNTLNTIVIFGEMGELAEQTEFYHHKIGTLMGEMGIDKLFTYGPQTQHTIEAFGQNGYYFEDKQELINKLESHLEPNSVILIKGSRYTGMEEVVEYLKNMHGGNT